MLPSPLPAVPLPLPLLLPLRLLLLLPLRLLLLPVLQCLWRQSESSAARSRRASQQALSERRMQRSAVRQPVQSRRGQERGALQQGLSGREGVRQGSEACPCFCLMMLTWWGSTAGRGTTEGG